MSKRKLRFEPRIYDEFNNWAVWDLMFDRWYQPCGEPILDGYKPEIEKRCQNLQRQFEWANPHGFLDKEMSGPDFMDDEWIFKN